MSKKIVCLLISLLLVLSLAVSSFAAIDLTKPWKTVGSDKYYYGDVISAGDPSYSLRYNQDYYFPLLYNFKPLTDDFLDMYELSLSITKDPADPVSAATFRGLFKVAEFVKAPTGQYYLHLRLKDDQSFYTKSANGGIVLVAKDRDYENDRSAYAVEFDISYDKNTRAVTDDDIDTTIKINDAYGTYLTVDRDETEIEKFKIEFADGSTLNFKSTKAEKINLMFDTTENQLIKDLNPNAKFEQVNFLGKPSFESSASYKFNTSSQYKYLYEVGDNATLTLLSSNNDGGIFTINTKKLGSYIASDIKLDGANLSAGSATPKASTNVSSTLSSTQNINTTTPSFIPNPSTGF